MTQPRLSDRFVHIGAATAPVFSRDGRTLFHLRGSSLAQPWALELETGQARALASHDEKVALLRRSPRSDQLLYGLDRGGDERQSLWLLDGDTPRALTADPAVIHDFGAWSPDGGRIAYTVNDRDEAHMDVVVHDLATGERQRVLHGRHETHVTAWHPDGSTLLVAQDHSSGDVRLFLLDLGSGQATPLPRPRASRYASARWTPGGALLALTDAHGSDFMALCRLDPATGAAEAVWAPPGRDVEAWSFSPDGRLLATVENDRGYAVLRIGPADAAERPVVDGLPHGVVSDLAWSPESTTLAVSAADPVTPPGLWLWTAAEGVRPAWQPDGAGVARFELMEWPSDGHRIPGWLALPPGPVPAGGFPAVIWVHGGPAAQARANFRPDMQSLLAQGYAVLMPNVRGSTGYGRAWMDSDDVDRRLDSVRDLAAGRHWLAAQPGIDADRIAVMGQSYGGYMVLAAITEYPDLWRCAIDFYGIAEFGTLLAATGPWRRAHRAAEYGDPLRHRALFDRISPIRHIDLVQVPILVLHGIRDPRVAIGESEQVVTALRARDRPVQYEVFDYAGHGFIRPADRLRAYAAVAEFLAKTL